MRADFAKGVSIFKRDDETLPEYFLSFSPMAPFFGVRWRFAPAWGLEAGEAAAAAVKAAPAKAKRAKTPAPKVIEAVAEPTPAPKAAPKPVEATPAAEPEPEAAPTGEPGKPALLYDAAPEGADDLKLIKGVGPKLEKELNALGVYTFAQVATLSPENLAWIDENLSAFKGRSVRDDWVGQAAGLMAA